MLIQGLPIHFLAMGRDELRAIHKGRQTVVLMFDLRSRDLRLFSKNGHGCRQTIDIHRPREDSEASEEPNYMDYECWSQSHLIP